MGHRVRFLILTALAFALSGCGAVPQPAASYTLTINIEGQGTVSSMSGTRFAPGTVVTLTAAPEPGWIFEGWMGPDGAKMSGNRLLMDGDKTITARFTGHLFVPVTTGAYRVYQVRGTQDGASIEGEETWTVTGSAPFAGYPDVIQVRQVALDLTVTNLYLRLVPGGAEELGAEGLDAGPPETVTYTSLNDPPEFLPTMKPGQVYTAPPTEEGEIMTLTAVRREALTVAAGTFDTLRVEAAYSSGNAGAIYWLGADGFGMVKAEYSYVGRGSFSYELKRYGPN